MRFAPYLACAAVNVGLSLIGGTPVALPTPHTGIVPFAADMGLLPLFLLGSL